MRLEDSPFDTLTTLVRQHASGELICASSTVEVHVYLQRGRIAWATDSEHPFAFTRHLQTTARIDAAGFHDILESCKREKRPLGETLVAWGLLTTEEIRDALRHQLELALIELRGRGRAQTLFLDRTRQYARYDEALTFSLEELLGPSAVSPPASSNGGPSRPPPASEGGAAPSARRLLDLVDDIEWAELFVGTTRVEAAPETAAGPRFAPELIERTLLDGANRVIVRLPDGVIAGATLSSSRSLWCRLGPDSTVGAAASALGAMVATEPSASWQAEDRPKSHAWALGDVDQDPSLQEIRRFLDRAPEIVAAVLRDESGERGVRGVGHVPLEIDATLDLVQRRARVLQTAGILRDGLVRDADANADSSTEHPQGPWGVPPGRDVGRGHESAGRTRQAIALLRRSALVSPLPFATPPPLSSDPRKPGGGRGFGAPSALLPDDGLVRRRGRRRAGCLAQGLAGARELRARGTDRSLADADRYDLVSHGARRSAKARVAAARWPTARGGRTARGAGGVELGDTRAGWAAVSSAR